MSVNLAPLPFLSELASNGLQLAGGKLFTYAAGTSTPQASYTDSTGGIANTNPVILNPRGEASVWLTQGVAYKLVLQDSFGNQIWSQDNIITPLGSDFQTKLADTTNPANGAGLIGYSAGQAYVFGTVGYKLNRQVSLLDYMTAAQASDFLSGTASVDITAAFQSFVNACSSNTAYGAPEGIMPAGRGLLTGTINYPNTYVNIRGAGMFATQLSFTTTTGSLFKPAAITYFKPRLQDFSVLGTNVTGIGLDLSAVTSQVYDGNLRNLYIWSGGDAIYAPNFFSMMIDTVIVNSYNGHGFRVACGPGVTFLNCYASQIPANKSGYRLIGEINLVNCNGVDAGDYWGIFGQDTTATDGFQNDFPAAGQDYPDITLINCNVEFFAKNGITAHQSYRHFDVIGGKIDRTNLSTAYISLITVRQPPVVSGCPVNLSFGYVFKGSGVPNGGAALTNAWLYAPTGQPVFVDKTGALTNAGITSFYSGTYAGTVPLATQGALNDVYQGSASSFNAVQTTRLTLGYTKYTTGAYAPVGSNQAISVTGIAKAIVTPAAAASISTATFDQVPGAGTDYQRNGDLLIEATNANLTIIHSASGVNTFRMFASANVTLTTGQVLRFCWSGTSTQWIQV